MCWRRGRHIGRRPTELQDPLLERPKLQSIENFDDLSRFDRAPDQSVERNGKFEIANKFVESCVAFDVTDLLAQIVSDDATNLVSVCQHRVE